MMETSGYSSEGTAAYADSSVSIHKNRPLRPHLNDSMMTSSSVSESAHKSSLGVTAALVEYDVADNITTSRLKPKNYASKTEIDHMNGRSFRRNSCCCNEKEHENVKKSDGCRCRAVNSVILPILCLVSVLCSAFFTIRSVRLEDRIHVLEEKW